MSLILDGTNGETFPSWTTATRPASPATGQVGMNTTIGSLEAYTGGGWQQFTNGPAFSVWCSTAQSVANATGTKVALNTKIFDTNSNFDATTNYRFTPTVAGYYLVTGGVYYSFTPNIAQTWIFKNGALMFTSVSPSTANGFLVPVTGLVYMNGSTDYLELYTYQNCGVSQNLIASRQDLNYFFGFFVRS